MMNVRIYTDRVERELTNFWNHIHFHPTDAAEDLWGQEILSHVARDKVAQYVRLHTMFEDIVTRGADGRLRFDYSGSDRRIDIMVSKGFRLLLCFDFMPPCMAVDQWNVSNLRYKNKRYNRSVPTDYAEWREVCRNYTAHLAERYGMDTVSEWLFHCWNEPDAGYWVSRPGNDEWDASGATDKLDEYLKLYDHFAEGVTSVTDRIRIGGPSCAGSDRFIRPSHSRPRTISCSVCARFAAFWTGTVWRKRRCFWTSGEFPAADFSVSTVNRVIFSGRTSIIPRFTPGLSTASSTLRN